MTTQRAHFNCPRGGQALTAVFSETDGLLQVAAIGGEATQQTDSWLEMNNLRVPWRLRDLPTAEAKLRWFGITDDLEWEGI